MNSSDDFKRRSLTARAMQSILPALYVLTACNVESVSIHEPRLLEDGTQLQKALIGYYEVCVSSAYVACSVSQYIHSSSTTIIYLRDIDLRNVKLKTVLDDGRESKWSNAIEFDGIQALKLSFPNNGSEHLYNVEVYGEVRRGGLRGDHQSSF